MGQRYRQLSIEERVEIARLSGAGRSIRQIAASLDRAPSSVARELKRNGAQRGYQPLYAQQQARARRWSGSRLERDARLRDRVLGQLKAGWSPEQIAGRASEFGQASIGTESIYRFIYAQIRRHKDYSWRHYLPRAKSKRGRRGQRGGSAARLMAHLVPLSERPAAVADRLVPGHWEADLMAFSKYGQTILMLHERMSRALIGSPLPSKQAAPVARAIGAALGTLPPELRQTMTFDNGTEFARHYELAPLGIATYFCDPHAPWQKSLPRRRPGAASRTPSAACAVSCRARPISTSSTPPTSRPSSPPTTTRPENALTGKPQPRPSASTCCTSNENPPPRFRGNDPVGVGEFGDRTQQRSPLSRGRPGGK